MPLQNLLQNQNVIILSLTLNFLDSVPKVARTKLKHTKNIIRYNSSFMPTRALKLF